MKKLTKKEAEAIRTIPHGRGSYAGRIIKSMKPGEIIFLERADWKAKKQQPLTYIHRSCNKKGMQYTCVRALDLSGWVIERIK